MLSVCPGCGLQRPSLGLDPDRKANASGECRAVMNEMTYYTLAPSLHIMLEFIARQPVSVANVH